jgi:hypothetical protein
VLLAAFLGEEAALGGRDFLLLLSALVAQEALVGEALEVGEVGRAVGLALLGGRIRTVLGR